jgi:hypothetical protein
MGQGKTCPSMLSGMEAARQRPARQPKQISIQNGADPLFLNGVDLNPVGNSFTPDFISAFLSKVPVSLDPGPGYVKYFQIRARVTTE